MFKHSFSRYQFLDIKKTVLKIISALFLEVCDFLKLDCQYFDFTIVIKLKRQDVYT
jgi:hypothetical protein